MGLPKPQSVDLAVAGLTFAGVVIGVADLGVRILAWILPSGLGDIGSGVSVTQPTEPDWGGAQKALEGRPEPVTEVAQADRPPKESLAASVSLSAGQKHLHL